MNKLSKYLFTVSLCASFLQPMVYAESIDSMKQRQEQLESQSQSLTNQLNEKQRTIDALNSDKYSLEQDVDTMQTRIGELSVQLDQQEKKLNETHQTILRLEKEIAYLQEVISQRTELLKSQARAVQINGNVQEILDILLEAESLTDLYNRANVLTTIIIANRTVIQQQKEDQLLLEEKQQTAQTTYGEEQSLKQEIEISKSNLIAQKSELDEKIEQIIAFVSLSEQEKDELAKKQADINEKTRSLSAEIEAEQERQAELKRKQEEEAARLAAEYASQQNQAQPESRAATSSQKSSYGFIMPAQGVYTSYFGWRLSPFGTGQSEFHTGLDIAGSGQILAVADGTVETAGFNAGGYGYYVVINHGVINGTQTKTLYAHLQPNMFVAAGQKVTQGQAIGIMGTTGYSTGVHLHFEVHINGRQVDPIGYL